MHTCKTYHSVTNYHMDIQYAPKCMLHLFSYRCRRMKFLCISNNRGHQLMCNTFFNSFLITLYIHIYKQQLYVCNQQTPCTDRHVKQRTAQRNLKLCTSLQYRSKYYRHTFQARPLLQPSIS